MTEDEKIQKESKEVWLEVFLDVFKFWNSKGEYGHCFKWALRDADQIRNEYISRFRK